MHTASDPTSVMHTPMDHSSTVHTPPPPLHAHTTTTLPAHTTTTHASTHHCITPSTVHTAPPPMHAHTTGSQVDHAHTTGSQVDHAHTTGSQVEYAHTTGSQVHHTHTPLATWLKYFWTPHLQRPLRGVWDDAATQWQCDADVRLKKKNCTTTAISQMYPPQMHLHIHSTTALPCQSQTAHSVILFYAQHDIVIYKHQILFTLFIGPL